MARVIQTELKKRQDIDSIVVNRPGADGLIGMQWFQQNQTNRMLVTATGPTLFISFLHPNMTFDTLKDIDVIGPLTTSATVIAVSQKSGIKNWNDFRERGTKQVINCGTSNAMAVFFAGWVRQNYVLNINVVKYKGTGPLMNDLVGGHIDCAIDGAGTYVGYDNIKIVALSSPDSTNNFQAPVINTSPYNFRNFYAVAIGRGTDPALSGRVLAALQSMVKDASLRDQFRKQALVLNPVIDLKFGPGLSRDRAFLDDFNTRYRVID